MNDRALEDRVRALERRIFSRHAMLGTGSGETIDLVFMVGHPTAENPTIRWYVPTDGSVPHFRFWDGVEWKPFTLYVHDLVLVAGIEDASTGVGPFYFVDSLGARVPVDWCVLVKDGQTLRPQRSVSDTADYSIADGVVTLVRAITTEDRLWAPIARRSL